MNKTERHLPLQQAQHGLQPQRLLRMDGVSNCRDLGGYPAADGRPLAWGRLYRSGTLYHASAADKQFLLQDLALQQLVDLRNAQECHHEPEPQELISALDYHHLPVTVAGTSREDIIRLLRQPGTDAAAVLQLANERLVLEHQGEFRHFFQVLLQADGPLLFHCTEGKDRTGFASLLLLSALGVDEPWIMQDYLLTNRANAEAVERRLQQAASMQMDVAVLRQLLLADARYLQQAMLTIRQHYGSMQAYLQQAMGLEKDDIRTLRGYFLQA